MIFTKYLILIMVISMKYVSTLIFLFFIFMFFFLDSFALEKTKNVFKEQEEFNYQFVSIDTKGLTTKNFFRYFEDTSWIVNIFPVVNPIYKNRLEDISFLCQRKCSIHSFEKYYKNLLEKNNFKDDSILIDYYGVSIEKIVVYVNQSELGKILKKCSVCKTNN